MPTLIERVLARGRLVVERVRYEKFTRPLDGSELRTRFGAAPDTVGADFFHVLADRHRTRPLFRELNEETLAYYRGKSGGLAGGRVSISGKERTLTADVNWHHDLDFGVSWPKRFVGSLADRRKGTDVDILWRLNKMQFLLELSAAYRATGDDALRRLGYRWLTSWCEQNPFMIGMNWRSPMEMGIRLLVWSVWLQEVPVPGNVGGGKLQSLFESMIRQAEHVAANLSERRVSNNHLINECATLYAFCTLWPELRDAESWKKATEEILVREIDRQILPDGFDFENAVNYHLFVLDSLLVFLLARAAENREAPRAVMDGVSTLSSVALAMISPSGRWPRVGDDSMSEFFVLNDLRALEGRAFEGVVRFADLLRPGMEETLRRVSWTSTLFELTSDLASAWRGAQSGLAVFRMPHAHLTYCAGPEHDLEFSSGHVHSDAGSFELEMAGEPVVIDSGTYLYGYDAQIRSHFRGASAHNSLLIDGTDPMTPVDTFSWLNVPRSRTLFWCEDPIPVVGSHRQCRDAAAHSFSHRRTLAWGAETMWIIVDVLTPDGRSSPGERDVNVHFHLPDAANVSAVDASRCEVRLASGAGLAIAGWSDSPYRQDIVTDRSDRRTWYSEHFGDLRFGTTLVGNVRAGESCVIAHAIYDSERGRVTPAFEAGRVRFQGAFDGEPVDIEVRYDESIRLFRNGTEIANALGRGAG